MSRFGFGVSKSNSGCRGRLRGARAEFGVSRFGFGVPRPHLGCRDPPFGMSGPASRCLERLRGALACQGWLWGVGGVFGAHLTPIVQRAGAPLRSPPSAQPLRRARAVAAVTADAAAAKWRRPARPPRPSRVPLAGTPAGPEPRDRSRTPEPWDRSRTPEP